MHNHFALKDRQFALERLKGCIIHQKMQLSWLEQTPHGVIGADKTAWEMLKLSCREVVPEFKLEEKEE